MAAFTKPGSRKMRLNVFGFSRKLNFVKYCKLIYEYFTNISLKLSEDILSKLYWSFRVVTLKLIEFGEA